MYLGRVLICVARGGQLGAKRRLRLGRHQLEFSYLTAALSRKRALPAAFIPAAETQTALPSLLDFSIEDGETGDCSGASPLRYSSHAKEPRLSRIDTSSALFREKRLIFFAFWRKNVRSKEGTGIHFFSLFRQMNQRIQFLSRLCPKLLKI